jgi:hypothetical protein
MQKKSDNHVNDVDLGIIQNTYKKNFYMHEKNRAAGSILKPRKISRSRDI